MQRYNRTFAKGLRIKVDLNFINIYKILLNTNIS